LGCVDAGCGGGRADRGCAWVRRRRRGMRRVLGRILRVGWCVDGDGMGWWVQECLRLEVGMRMVVEVGKEEGGFNPSYLYTGKLSKPARQMAPSLQTGKQQRVCIVSEIEKNILPTHGHIRLLPLRQNDNMTHGSNMALYARRNGAPAIVPMVIRASTRCGTGRDGWVVREAQRMMD